LIDRFVLIQVVEYYFLLAKLIVFTHRASRGLGAIESFAGNQNRETIADWITDRAQFAYQAALKLTFKCYTGAVSNQARSDPTIDQA
jgi:hypothetical protein